MGLAHSLVPSDRLTPYQITGFLFLSQLNDLIPLWSVPVGMRILGDRPEPNARDALGLILGGIPLIRLEWRHAFRKRTH